MNTRNTRWAVVKETTEGTPVSPTSANEYVALQDGAFELQGEFETIESAEIKASIGAAKSIRGFENPSATYSHYLKHSGVEAQKPEYDYFLESLLGSVHSRSTERDTIAGSTAGTASVRGTLVVNTGEGAEFTRGHIVLIKNSTNGYSVRFVYSVSSDTLSINFNLANAPGVGVNLGKGITFIPANSGHPSLSIWDYRGNALTQMAAGMQCTQMSISATAGELINAEYTLGGLKIHQYPLEVVASNKFLDVTDDSGTFFISASEKIYRSPHELAGEIESKLNGAGRTNVFVVAYLDASGKFKITSNGTVLSLLWKTGTHGSDNTDTHIGTLLGYDDTANDTGAGGATGYTSDSPIASSSSQTPSLDSSSPIVAKNIQLIVGNFDQTSCVDEGVQSFEATITTDKPKTPNFCAESGQDGSVASGRKVEGKIVITMPQYEALKFNDFVNNNTRALQFTFGEKDSAGNWQAGKTGALYCSDLVYTSHLIGDANGIVTLELDFSGHVDSSGNGEVYIGYV